MRYITTVLCALLLLPFGSTPVLGQAQPVASVESEIDNIIRQALDSVRAVPGLQVAVVQGDSVPYAKRFGLRNVDTGAPVMPQSVF